jgi:hypothetical protein
LSVTTTPQVQRRAAGDLIAQPSDRPQSEHNPDPYQDQRDIELHEIPQQRAHETEARLRFVGGSHIGNGDCDDAGLRFEASGQRTHAAVIDLRHRQQLSGIRVHGDDRQARVAAEQTPLRIVQREPDRVGVGQRSPAIRTQVQRHLALLHDDMRHQHGRGFLQPPVAADDRRSHIVEVVHQGAAQRDQHERNCQPKDQLATDRRAHVGLLSSRR